MGAEKQINNKLENVAINDALPLKTAWLDAIANLNVLVPRDTSDLWIYIHYAAPPYSVRTSAWAQFTSSRLANSVCRVQRLPTKQNAKFAEGG